MLLPLLAIVVGLVVLVWSADKFVEGAAATAKYAGMPPLLIGMVIVGFGTSAPEMVVSAFAAWEGSPALVLGNAYGSNIFNIAFILGVTALIAPIAVHSSIVRREMLILLAVTLLAGWQLWNGDISRMDASVLLLLVFFALMGWSIWQALRNVVGSNLFNTLAVVGIAGTIAPMQVAGEVLSRDWPVMLAMTAGLFVMAYGFLKPGHLTRWEGGLLQGLFASLPFKAMMVGFTNQKCRTILRLRRLADARFIESRSIVYVLPCPQGEFCRHFRLVASGLGRCDSQPFVQLVVWHHFRAGGYCAEYPVCR